MANRSLLRSADVVFAQTPSERDAIAAVGIPHERIVLQGLGVEPRAVARRAGRIDARQEQELDTDEAVLFLQAICEIGRVPRIVGNPPQIKLCRPCLQRLPHGLVINHSQASERFLSIACFPDVKTQRIERRTQGAP